MATETVVKLKKAKVRFVVRNGRAINAPEDALSGVVVVDLAEELARERESVGHQEFGRAAGKWAGRWSL